MHQNPTLFTTGIRGCLMVGVKDEDDLDQESDSEGVGSRWKKDTHFCGRAVRICQGTG